MWRHAEWGRWAVDGETAFLAWSPASGERASTGGRLDSLWVVLAINS